MEVTRLDHLVLTVSDIEKTTRFYESVLGMRRLDFGEERVALGFGEQKLNLHQLGSEFTPKAEKPTPGSADLCFVTSLRLRSAMEHARANGVDAIEGPVHRTGALGPMRSFYFRDPDSNLIEVCSYEVE